MSRFYSTFLFMFLWTSIYAQDQSTAINPQLLKNQWPAAWISCPDVSQRDYGIYHFRKTFSLERVPASFIIHVSADNRYRLFVNGKPICSGPARGDLYNWYFETIDIAPFLHAGENVVAATVWNMGILAPVGQISNQTAFVLQGDGAIEQVVNTNSGWKVIKDESYQPCSRDNMERLRAYMVVGPGDRVDAAGYPWGWEQADYNDQNWKAAVRIAAAIPFGTGSDNLWTLVPRNIPLMEEHQQRLGEVRRSSGIQVPQLFVKGKEPLQIPANQTVSVLFDQKFNTTAFPQLVVSGGKGASVRISYAEALVDKNRQKGNRNEIEGKELIGDYDIFLPDGGEKRQFRPLWFRTYRYVQLDISTSDQPLTIEDFYGMYTGYPFEQKATFSSNDSSLQRLWNTGWRTARLCAGETYFDCPYYEQLQYEGDTRIQALISLYVTGDDRLMRKAILDFYHSRVPEGLTQGRYPSSRLQVIPSYSLFWVSMVYDYWMHRKDDAFVEQFLPAIDALLHWYQKNIDPQKMMLGPMKWWNFVDWADAFPGGVPSGANDGNSSVNTLHFAYTLEQAARLNKYFGNSCQADQYNKLASSLCSATYRLCFDNQRNEMADTPEKKEYSQHAGIMALLAGAIPESSRKTVMKKLLDDASLAQVTFYFRFYLTQALKKAGMGDVYYSQLKPWRDMLDLGLTTFAEKPEPTRSDCHAWSACPLYDFLAVVCGIVPESPGFSTVRIAPALGGLTEVTASMPHPNGEIKMHLNKIGETGIDAEIILPPGLKGDFEWMGHRVHLHEGQQHLFLK
ncbi:MAG: alpha-L-rhamnosidase N-terminal domain-containing protein [Bacteroidota bacterium]|nr:alpha-L-rhamnosidase N-terminal domain-containing protein [Bacteroidota bacterium]